MKLDAIIARDAEGDRLFGARDLPLSIGTGADCDIRLPGPGNNAIALLDELDGSAFIQPIGRHANLKINDSILNASTRLNGGDEIDFYGTTVTVGQESDAMLLHIRVAESAYITRPPEHPDSTAALAEEKIAPTVFRRAEETVQAEPQPVGFRWQTVVGGVIALLLGVSWLLFTSKSIQFDVQPAGADRLAVDGGWFRLSLGDRTLLREGSYTVHVEREGYYDVAQSIEIDATPSRTIVVEMRKLPGQLTVATDPAIDALVTVNQDKLGRAPYGPLELEPGTHIVTVTADRYLPFTQALTVPGLGVHQQLTVQLVPQWADVEISSAPTGATVLQGTTELGVTPLSLELLEGTHSLTMIRDGFKAWDGTIVAAANVDQSLPTVQLEPANAQLQVNTIPRGANVTVNGRYRGQSPVRISLSPEVDYVIGLSKAGYGTAERRVRLEAAKTDEIVVDLSARSGEVTVAALPGDATVYVDGQARGTGTVKLNLSSAPHKIEVKRDGYESFSRDITPRPGYPQEINVRLLSEAEVKSRGVANSYVNSQGQEMRRVEPGEFTLGTSRREQGRRANEVIVPMRITRPYSISTKEVTNREFRRFRSNHDSRGDIHASLAGDLNPVVNVSWNEVVEYCNWLSAQEGLTPAYEQVFQRWQPIEPVTDGYRLPTEAEWVWAIRYQGRPTAGTFPWGARLPPRRDSGNYAGKSANALVPSILPGYDDGYASTSPVGTFPANALGLYDGGGNVSEWVQDYYSVQTPGQTTALEDYAGPNRGSNRVIRGSSWAHAGILQLRFGYRASGNDAQPDVGFRIARNVQ